MNIAARCSSSTRRDAAGQPARRGRRISVSAATHRSKACLIAPAIPASLTVLPRAPRGDRRGDHSADDGSTEPPVDLLDKALVELGIVGAFRALAYALVEPARIVADQDAPAPLLHPIEDGFRRRRRSGWCFIAKRPRTVERDLLNGVVRQLGR